MLSKKAKYQFIKSISFCLILFFLLTGISYIFKPRDNSISFGMIEDGARGFLSEKKKTIDAFFIGNSNAYAGISPMILWKQYGYTSYISSEAGQNISQATFLLDEILSYEKPKMIILEVDEFYGVGYQNIIDTTFNRTVPLLYNHNCWKNLKSGHMFRETIYTKHRKNKGFWPVDTVVAFKGPEYMAKTDKIEKIPTCNIPYLLIFVNICKRNNIQLMLLHLPSAINWNYNRHNAVSEFAEDNDLLFLDLDTEREKIGFDWTTDSRDGGNHLNSSGADKCSTRIGEFIQNNYSLKDHRSDPQFYSWNKDYEGYPHNTTGRE